MSDHNTDSEPSEASGPDVPARRNFIARLGAIVAGGVASLVPIAAGAAALLDPLRRGGGSGAMVRVTRVSALPADGSPRKFTVQADRTDAWSTYADTPVGAVYLRRTPDGVAALNVVCPHAGCFVRLADDRSRFQCPCHNSRFDLDGDVNDPSSPSPRSMDALSVEVRNGDEVWVRFENFLPGRSEKIPV